MLHNAHNVTVSDGHRVRYKRGGAGVGGVLASQPLTPHTPYFEVTVENPGQRATIAIGVSCRGYPLSAQPGSYLVVSMYRRSVVWAGTAVSFAGTLSHGLQAGVAARSASTAMMGRCSHAGLRARPGPQAAVVTS